MYREAYSVNFNAGLSFWLDWLADAPSTRLFEKALSSCPHFELAIKYIEFSFSLVEEEKMVSALLFLPFAFLILNSLFLFYRLQVNTGPFWSA